MKKTPVFQRLARKHCPAARVLAGAIATLLAAQAAHASSAVWNGLGSDSSWLNAINWGNPAAVPGTTDTATFNGNGNGFASIDTTNGVSINSILFDTGAAAYTLGNQGAIQLDPGGNITMNAGVTSDQVINSAVNIATGAFTISNNSTTNSLTIGGDISGADYPMELRKTGSGQVIFTGTNHISPDQDTSAIGKLSVMGGGKLTIPAGATWAGQDNNTNRSGTPAGLYIGTNADQSLASGNNTLELTGTARIFASAMHMGAGAWTATNDNGHNTFNVSAPRTASGPFSGSSYFVNSRLASGEAEIIGLATDYNVVNMTNGAFYYFNNGGGGAFIGYGAPSGTTGAGSGNHNGFNVSGHFGIYRSLYYFTPGRWLVCGEYGNSNYINTSDGAGINVTRCAIGEDGNGNFIHANGPSFNTSANVVLAMFTVGGNAGTLNTNGNGSGNYVLIDGGAALSATGGASVQNCIGGTAASSNNFMQVDGLGSTMTIQMNNAPLTIGGSFINNVNNDAPNASGNYLAVTDGGYAHVNSVYLAGTGSKIKLGNGTAHNIAQLEARGDSSVAYPIPINLLKSDSRLEINNGRLVAGRQTGTAGAMVSGAGQINLLGPAYFSTAFSTSSIGSVISGTGSLTKEGAGKLTLAAGTNTYNGDTNLVGGYLELTSPNPNNDSSKVTIDTNSAMLILSFDVSNGDVTDTVGELWINGNKMADGTWGSSNSSASNIDDNAFAGVGTLTVVGAAALPTYASWAGAMGIPGALPNDDADNDGVPNAVEMVLGGDPKNSMDVKLLPELELVTDPGEGVPAGDYLKFTYRRTQLSVDAGLIAACEYGSDLVSEWTPVVSPYPEGVVVLEDKPFAPYSTIALTDRVRVFVPRAGSAKLFGRLRVTVP